MDGWIGSLSFSVFLHLSIALRITLDEALPLEKREAQRLQDSGNPNPNPNPHLEVARQLGVEAIDQRGIVPPLPLGLGRTHARRWPRAPGR
eukprot:scaffold39610_cov45-Phaeocystis_antarctica.AAC.1